MERLGSADPQRVGPYDLLGRLGAGGMGAVYLGRSAGGRTVAVKVVRPELAGDRSFRERFRLEVDAARRVSGAFTAPVVDADTEAPVAWMATSFVVGVPLQQAVQRHGPLPEGTVLTLAAGLAEALRDVHRAGVIHRDLKPANVLVALDGPHVIDFGISRAADGTALTTTGAVVGSAPYMSPEQALGEPLTPASDVFSLGSTVAYAALGRHLYGEGAAAAVLFRVVSTEPDLGALPHGLRHLVAACLAKNPAHRPTPGQLVELVQRIGRPRTTDGWLPPAVATDVLAVRGLLTAPPEPPAAEPPHVGPPPAEPPHVGPPPAEPTTGPQRFGRRKVLLGVAGGVLAAAGTGTAVTLLHDRSTGTTAGGAGFDRPDGDDVPEGLLSWKVTLPEPCLQTFALPGQVIGVTGKKVLGIDGQGKTAWTFEGSAKNLTFSLTAFPGNLAATDGNGLYVGAQTWTGTNSTSALAAVDPEDGTPDWTLTADRDGTSVLRLAGIRGGRAFAIGLGNGRGGTLSGHVWAVDLASRGTAWFQGLDWMPVFAACPREGDHLVVAGMKQLAGLDGQGRVVWSQDGTRTLVGTAGPLVLTTEQDTLSAVDPATGKAVWTVKGVATYGTDSALPEDGRVVRCVLKDDGGGLSLAALDARTGKTLQRTPLPREHGEPFAVLRVADGNVYRMGADAVIWALDPTTGKPRWKFTGLRGSNLAGLTWSAGGGRVCVAESAASRIAVLAANGA
ncbi:PQQ-binding-like beta-propeller repeat protein [Kitasatospora sp. NPDC093550]|uniref:serine/threonine-protein kinase n=1 Tax=Kitasatospora sp. NPDC093550 TaxID=3364089 RepID=UPI00381EA1F1